MMGRRKQQEMLTAAFAPLARMSPLRNYRELKKLVVYYGGAKPGDDNFADVVAIDAEILEVLAEREQRRRKERKCPSR